MNHGSKWIDKKTMVQMIDYIPNNDSQNYPLRRLELVWLKRLDTQLNELTNQNCCNPCSTNVYLFHCIFTLPELALWLRVEQNLLT